MDPPPPPPRPAAATPGTATTAPITGRHFWIATVQPPEHTGFAQWDVDVYVNQVFVKRFRSKDPEPIHEITRFLRPGANLVHFSPRKQAGDRLSASPNDFFELVIGDGEMRAGQVMLNKVVDYRRTAAETAAADTEETLPIVTDGTPTP
jgi:hypothetical protein